MSNNLYDFFRWMTDVWTNLYKNMWLYFKIYWNHFKFMQLLFYWHFVSFNCNIGCLICFLIEFPFFSPQKMTNRVRYHKQQTCNNHQFHQLRRQRVTQAIHFHSQPRRRCSDKHIQRKVVILDRFITRPSHMAVTVILMIVIVKCHHRHITPPL